MKAGGSAYNRGIKFVSGHYTLKFRALDKEHYRAVLKQTRPMEPENAGSHAAPKPPFLRGLASIGRINPLLVIEPLILLFAEKSAKKRGSGKPNGLFSLLAAASYLAAFGYLIVNVLYKIGNTWRFHGAEHKVIAACLKNDSPTFDEIKASPRIARRCGTVFVVIFAAVSAFVNRLIKSRPLASLVSTVLAFELFNSEKLDNKPVFRHLIRLGYFLQTHLFTKEPEDWQLKMASEAFSLLAQAEKGEIKAGTWERTVAR